MTNALAVRLAITAAIGGLLFGYDTAVISGAVDAIDHNFIQPRHLTETAANSLSGWTISSALVGCVLGSALAGRLGDGLGRRGGMIVAGLLFLLSAVGSAVPEIGQAPLTEMVPGALVPFILFRVAGGFAIGIASTLCPLYIAEIAPPESRGRLVALQQMAIVTGIFVVYFVNWGIAAQGSAAWVLEIGWRYMLASMAIPALLFLALLATVPDTPRWLAMRGRDDEAADVLRRLGTPDVAATMRQIRETFGEGEGRAPISAYGWPVIAVGLLLGIFQQFVGINAIMYYAPLMFRNMGASENGALLQTILVGGINFASTILAILYVDRFGRKPLLLFGSTVTALAMFVLAGLFASGSVGIAALVAVLVYIFGFAVSWGPIVWVLLAEMFPNAIKGRAMPLAVAASWLANLAVSASFKVMDGSSGLNAIFHHSFAYLLYGAMAVLSGLFVWRFVPETKGRSLEAAEELWAR